LITGFSGKSGEIKQMGVTDIQIKYGLAEENNENLSGSYLIGATSHNKRLSPQFNAQQTLA